jgi:hypothetical protein
MAQPAGGQSSGCSIEPGTPAAGVGADPLVGAAAGGCGYALR